MPDNNEETAEQLAITNVVFLLQWEKPEFFKHFVEDLFYVWNKSHYAEDQEVRELATESFIHLRAFFKKMEALEYKDILAMAG